VDSYQTLADFVIENYSQEWALMLIDLIDRQYLRFREWLSREKPSERPPSQRPALS
jgi:hypothetical protein